MREITLENHNRWSEKIDEITGDQGELWWRSAILFALGKIYNNIRML
jgi:hypothetical protein